MPNRRGRHAENADKLPLPDNRQVFIGAREVALRLGCSLRHVQRLVSEKKLPPPFRLVGLVRWNVLDIDEWISRQCDTRSEDINQENANVSDE